jgi:hypothetical protein
MALKHQREPDGLTGLRRAYGGQIDEIPEDMPGFGVFISSPDFQAEQPVKTARHERQLQVQIHLHSHGRGEGVRVEKVDSIADVVFNELPSGTIRVYA